VKEAGAVTQASVASLKAMDFSLRSTEDAGGIMVGTEEEGVGEVIEADAAGREEEDTAGTEEEGVGEVIEAGAIKKEAAEAVEGGEEEGSDLIRTQRITCRSDGPPPDEVRKLYPQTLSGKPQPVCFDRHRRLDHPTSQLRPKQY